VTSSIGKTYQNVPDQQQFGTANFAGTTRGAGIQVTQPLFRGFRTQAETEAAKHQVEAARAKLGDIEQQVFLDTATAFLDILRDERVLNVARDNEKVLQQKLQETQERSHIGELTQTDTHQAESRLARAQVASFQAESALSKSRAAYRRLVGHAPEGLRAPDIAVDQTLDLDAILHLAETRNPAVIAANDAIDEAQARDALNKGALLPEIDLIGNSGRNWEQNSTLPGREDSTQIMLQLTVPLYHAGMDYSRAREAEQTAMQRRMELEEARTKAHETATNAWQALATAQVAATADDKEIDAAERALKGVREEAKMGVRTTLDVLNAEQELLDAKVDKARAQHDRDLAVLQIKASIGVLTAEKLKLPIDTYDPERHYDDVRGQWVGFSRDDARYDVSPAVAQTVP
jgi:TolC family type I secretion outer membrane protein